MATTLDEVMVLAKREQGLAVVATLRADQTIQASLVNAGALLHPITGEAALAFVTYGSTKLRNIRARPHIALTFRSGWTWATVEGAAEVIGPDDPHPQIDAERLRLLLREVFTAAGGEHDDWDTYDRTMLEQGRAAVFVAPSRIYSN
ncbi:MAG: TIGR03618 family F420-dependent PPOX class oxidoreductase [Ilumatobacteraceae bacterium]